MDSEGVGSIMWTVSGGGSIMFHPWIHVQYSPKENSWDYITSVHRFHHILDFVPRQDFHFTRLFIIFEGQ